MSTVLNAWNSGVLAARHPRSTIKFLTGDKEDLQEVFLRDDVTELLAQSIGELDPTLEQDLSTMNDFGKTIWKRLEAVGMRWKPLKKIECNYLYLLCRAIKPRHVVETGVQNGLSSIYILKALHENKYGTLHSIDLPNSEYKSKIGRIADKLARESECGWLVPEELRGRWRLLLGDSRQLLPSLLEDLGDIDIFLHDSEHTYKMMMFEYSLAWKHLRQSGVLISDDIDLSDAFHDFFLRSGSKGDVRYLGKGMPKMAAVLKT